MEFCDGTTLRELINGGQLQKDEALIWRLFRQICDALAYIHSKGLIHRDLKPPNIFLSRADSGQVKVGDFGLTTEARAELASSPDVGATAGGAGACAPSTGVGTVFYMAPEMLHSDSSRGGAAVQRRQGGGAAAKDRPRRQGQKQPYDQKVDMFSLGVIFLEMWHPPFATVMERARLLGSLAEGLAGPADGPARRAAGALLPQDVHAPEEVGKILGSLLAREPSERMAAEQLLDSKSGLLPPGAYDPQVQRILSALESPSSTESVALIQALFARMEDAGKDAPFFEQVFRAGALTPDVEVEARDAVQHVFQDLCRRHGALFEPCPLLRPATEAPPGRRAPEATDGADSPTAVDAGRCAPPRGCQLLDAGNTLLELRTNLTEPFARAAAASFAAAEAAEAAEAAAAAAETTPTADTDGGWSTTEAGGAVSGAGGADPAAQGAVGAPWAWRRYHTGTVYQSFKGAQFGHPKEVSSAVLQFAWRPVVPADQQVGRLLELAAAGAHEAELLHLLAELFVAIGSGSPSGRAEVRLGDSRLLPLLLECAAQRSVREARPGDTPASHAGVAPGERAGGSDARTSKLRARLTDVLRAHAPVMPVGAVARERAAAELATVFFNGAGNGGAAEGRAVPEVGALKTWPMTASIIAELEDLYATQPTLAAGHPEAAASSAAERLWEVLQGMRRILRSLDGLLEVTLDVLWRSSAVAYGHGLAFRVFLRDAASGSVTLVGEGGRVDTLLAEFAELHQVGGSPSAWKDRGTPRGVSVELAVDKLAAAVTQAADPAQPPVAGRRAATRLPTWPPPATVPAWWRQLPSCRPHVLVGVGDEDGGNSESLEALGFADEALRLATGLWRLGARCEVHPADAGPLDFWGYQQYGAEPTFGSSVPDFVVMLRRDAHQQEFAGQNGQVGSVPSGGSGVASSSRRGNGKGTSFVFDAEASEDRDPALRLSADDESRDVIGGDGFRLTGLSSSEDSDGERERRRKSGGRKGDKKQRKREAMCKERRRETSVARCPYVMRALTDQGLELLERSTRDAGVREFEDRHRVLDFFEKLVRRLPSRQLGLALPRTVSDSAVEH